MIENNSEIDDTKNIIEKIVGEDTFLTKKKKTQDSKNKKEFLHFMGLLETTAQRGMFLIEEMGIDLGRYDFNYWEIIHFLIKANYGDEIQAIIGEYLISKSEGNDIEYNPEDIWEEIKRTKIKSK